jgi:hypothetical protein
MVFHAGTRARRSRPPGGPPAGASSASPRSDATSRPRATGRTKASRACDGPASITKDIAADAIAEDGTRLAVRGARACPSSRMTAPSGGSPAATRRTIASPRGLPAAREDLGVVPEQRRDPGDGGIGGVRASITWTWTCGSIVFPLLPALASGSPTPPRTRATAIEPFSQCASRRTRPPPASSTRWFPKIQRGARASPRDCGAGTPAVVVVVDPSTTETTVPATGEITGRPNVALSSLRCDVS